MEGQGTDRFVDFATYCPKCMHLSKDESEDPCRACLLDAVNTDSRKPVMYEERKK